MRTRRTLKVQGYFFYIYIIPVLFLLAMPLDLYAYMGQIDDEDMSDISGQAGVSYAIHGSQLQVSADSISISDTDHADNWLEFNDITVDDGAGGSFSADTPDDSAFANTFDVGTSDTGQTMMFMTMSNHYLPRTYTVNELKICDQDIGGIRIKDWTRDPLERLVMGVHRDGTSGVDMEYHTKWDIGCMEYRYRFHPVDPWKENYPGSLKLEGIHLSRFAIGSPEDPTSWQSLGSFKFGDMADDRPITMDVATYDGSAKLIYNIPMEGSLRVENVELQKKSYGPLAIDGIKVNHLYIILDPM